MSNVVGQTTALVGLEHVKDLTSVQLKLFAGVSDNLRHNDRQKVHEKYIWKKSNFEPIITLIE